MTNLNQLPAVVSPEEWVVIEKAEQGRRFVSGEAVPLAVFKPWGRIRERRSKRTERTCAFAFDVGEDGGKAGELVELLRWLSGMGVETATGVVPGVDRVEPLEIIGREIVPEIAGL